MPYIPERRVDDKPDTFTPFVPFDPDSIVEICNLQLVKRSELLKKNIQITYQKNKILMWLLLLALLVYFSLKQYKGK